MRGVGVEKVGREAVLYILYIFLGGGGGFYYLAIKIMYKRLQLIVELRYRKDNEDGRMDIVFLYGSVFPHT